MFAIGMHMEYEDPKDEQIEILENTLELVKDQFEQYKLTTFSKDDWKDRLELRREISNIMHVNELKNNEIAVLKSLNGILEKTVEWQLKIMKANNMKMMVDYSTNHEIN